MKRVLMILVSLVFIFSFTRELRAEPSSVRKNVATVMFAGLGGAVLGLSTLSFYGNPQDHIGNIWTGLALGIVGGTVYVATQGSKKPPYQEVNNEFLDNDKFSRKFKTGPVSQVPVFAYSWDF